MQRLATTRRALLGAMAAAPIAVATPAVGHAAGCPTFRAIMNAQDVARHRFNTLPAKLELEDEPAFLLEEDRMLEASRLADQATPTTWSELVRWVEHITHGGQSSIDDDLALRLLAHARRLAGEARS